MDRDEASVYLLLIVAILAVVGLGLGIASFTWNESMGSMMGGSGSGMMGNPGPGTSSGPGAFEWTILILSAAFFLLAVFLLIRGRGSHRSASAAAPPLPAPYATLPSQRPTLVPTSEPSNTPANAPAVPQAPPAVSEPTLVKLLNEDERRMYLELRDHGGQMFQRDLVALGVFSKAKVTRVLDKLEAKGLIVREAHGMTNRVRLVGPPAH